MQIIKYALLDRPNEVELEYANDPHDLFRLDRDWPWSFYPFFNNNRGQQNTMAQAIMKKKLSIGAK